MNQPGSATGTNAAQNGGPNTPANQPQQLNDARRPQRLYHKVQIAMKLAVKIFSDRRFTESVTFYPMKSSQSLSKRLDCKFASACQYTLLLFVAISANATAIMDETIDSWQIRTYHDYRPDVRIAIKKALETKWHLFDCSEASSALDMDDVLGGGDDFVPSELLLAAFYDE